MIEQKKWGPSLFTRFAFQTEYGPMGAEDVAHARRSVQDKRVTKVAKKVNNLNSKISLYSYF